MIGHPHFDTNHHQYIYGLTVNDKATKYRTRNLRIELRLNTMKLFHEYFTHTDWPLLLDLDKASTFSTMAAAIAARMAMQLVDFILLLF